MLDFLSYAAMPLLVLVIIAGGYLRGIQVFDAFLEGAKEGAKAAFDVLPVMIGILAAVSMLNASGFIEILTGLIHKPAGALGVQKELLPLLIIRPFSGSASMGLFTEQISKVGPDSYLGNVLSTIMGSSETVIYTLAVYFGAANVENTRNALFASLVSSYAGMFAAVYICKIL